MCCFVCVDALVVGELKFLNNMGVDESRTIRCVDSNYGDGIGDCVGVLICRPAGLLCVDAELRRFKS